jgi:vanillate O-demethylase ferredoxin subunit
MNDLKVKVLAKTFEAEDIFSYQLASSDGAPLPAFSAGSHVDVQIRPGLIRQYSLCNDPEEQHRYVIGVLRDPASRGGSIAFHDNIKEGDEIQISMPKNHFPLVPAKYSLLFAGGIGITPILCMAERLARTDAEFEMHYCSRSVARTAFRQRIAASAFAGRVHFHTDDGDVSQKLDVSTLLADPQSETHLYVCGPTGFIDHVVNSAKAHGWRPENVHLEYFGAQAIDTSQDDRFEVKIASTGQVISVPADVSVATALAQHGIEIPLSCEQGVCGTCITRILDGEPDHRDMYFTDAERARNDQFTPCCSRSKSKVLILDL